MLSQFSIQRVRDGFIVLFAVLVLSGCSRSRELMPTPAVWVDATLSPFSAISQEFQSNKVDVFYVTDRKPVMDEKSFFTYGYSRDQSLAFGSCIVEIGKQVGWQALLEMSSTLRRKITLPLTIKYIEEIGRFPATPYSLVESSAGFEVRPDVQDRDECVRRWFHNELSRRLALTPRKEAYIFVHGVSCSFNDSVFSIAEIWHFLGREGVPIAYSWPAGIGGLRGYTYDRESGEFTIYHLKKFLRMLAENPELEKIHIISHSRGTDVCTTALRELFIEVRGAGNSPQNVFKIGNLILAAPDLDEEVVIQRIAAERLQLGVDRLTIYVSPYDRALGLSDWLFQGIKRLGKIGADDLTEQQKKNLAKFKGVNFIDVTAHSDFLGHGYFHSNPSVSADLILQLRDNRDPGAEHGRPLKMITPGFWELQKGYPISGNDSKPTAGSDDRDMRRNQGPMESAHSAGDKRRTADDGS